LHPAYCPPLNADYDGDQMGVFALYSSEAIQEAKEKIFKRIDGYRNYSEEMYGLEKDFVMGLYLLTKLPKSFDKIE
jgi:DNA-directed RNA polymerase subunit A'